MCVCCVCYLPLSLCSYKHRRIIVAVSTNGARAPMVGVAAVTATAYFTDYFCRCSDKCICIYAIDTESDYVLTLAAVLEVSRSLANLIVRGL